MQLVRTPSGTVEIASPMFHGSITSDVADELAGQLRQLARAARRIEREDAATRRRVSGTASRLSRPVMGAGFRH